MCQLLLSGVGYVPTPNVHLDVWDRVGSYTICTTPCTQTKVHFQIESKLIISILVQLQHLLLPSLIVTSSQVRVVTPLPLRSCCISGLGPEGLRHNRTIPVWSPGNLLRVTLVSRGNSASKNLWWETQWPKCCLYETPYVAAPVRETGDIIARTLLYAQLPSDAPTRTRICFGSQVMHFSRDLSC